MSFINKLFGGSAEPEEEKLLPWIPLNSVDQLNYIEGKSKSKTQVIFKHSTRCGISRMVINQFTSAYNLTEKDLDLYYLDLLSYRNVSDEVGYKFQVNAKILVLSAGFSHTIDFPIPGDLVVKQDSPTKITILGISKEKVGFFASKIREKRPPEPYKGKGILFEGEIVLRKAGKTGR